MSSSRPQTAASQTEERWRTYIKRVRERDSECLGKLYDESSRLLFGLALRILNDRADAEEVMLDVYQHVWNHCELYDEARGSVWAWLMVMTRNRAIDRLRQGTNRRAREVPIEKDHDWAGGGAIPEEVTIFQQERRMVLEAMEGLNAEQRQAIALAFFEGLTHSEVAQRVGAPLGTIKTRIRVGLRRLREALPPGIWIGARVDAQ